jgi:hypothetical protein
LLEPKTANKIGELPVDSIPVIAGKTTFPRQ